MYKGGNILKNWLIDLPSLKKFIANPISSFLCLKQKTMHAPLKKNLHVFLIIVGLLLIIGFIFIYSASSVFALAHFQNPHYYVKKQLLGIVLSLSALCITALLPLNIIKRLSPIAFAGSLILMILTLFSPLGIRIHGSARWLNLGFMAIQPGELLRMSALLFSCYILSKKQQIWKLKTYIPLMCIIGIASILLLQQPDFGTAVTIAGTIVVLLYIIGLPLKHLLLLISGSIPLGLLLIVYKPYRFKRILTFLNPWSDPQGSGFQIIQSLIAIGSGHWLGSGISHSKQKFFYLPMQHTDFIFSIIAEETGFLGASLLILLYIAFLYYGLKIVIKLTDPFSYMCTLSFVLLISLQALINIGVATGLLPTKGIGLPFVSYGTSALMVHCMMIGIIINCVRNSLK